MQETPSNVNILHSYSENFSQAKEHCASQVEDFLGIGYRLRFLEKSMRKS